MKGLALIGVIVLVVIGVVCGPIALIWSLNALFGLGIPFTFKTWLAACVLGGVVSGAGR
jgi:hypothetical protein